MNLASEIALTTYYFGTLPLRASLRHRLESTGKAPVCVLFYHRVADSSPNNWTISNARFQQQVHWLQRHYEVVSLEEAQSRIACGHNQKITVTITFDDGYADNWDQAIPFLIERQIPCTYFVALDFIKQGRPFPHDQAAGKPLPPNSPEQIVEMSQSGIDIGAHTRRHKDIGQITNQAELFDEIVVVRNELSQLVGQPIRYFAFPFGQHPNLSDQAFKMARDAGYQGACSAYGNYNSPGDDPFHIQRIHGDPQLCRLKNWLTIDPRKFGRVTPYRIDWGS